MKRIWIVLLCLGFVVFCAIAVRNLLIANAVPQKNALDDLDQQLAKSGGNPLAREIGRRPADGSGGIPVPRVKSVPVALRSGEVFGLPNGGSRPFRIESRYPLEIRAGSCRSKSTTLLECPGAPDVIEFRDTRKPHTWWIPPPHNQITITFLTPGA